MGEFLFFLGSPVWLTKVHTKGCEYFAHYRWAGGSSYGIEISQPSESLCTLIPEVLYCSHSFTKKNFKRNLSDQGRV